jgi:hypothetical protein
MTIYVRLYLTSSNTINAIIVVDIVITTDCCDPVVDPAGVDRPDQERGPSAFVRKAATTRR